MTLVEVIIAIALLAIVAVGAVGTFTTLLTSNRANTASTQLQAQTHQVMEVLRNVSFTALPGWNGTSIIIGGVTVNIIVTQVQPDLLQVQATGVRPGRVGDTFTLVTLRSTRGGSP
jgi:type II secretory pathway component PulJ